MCEDVSDDISCQIDFPPTLPPSPTLSPSLPSAQLSQLIINTGGVAAVVDYIGDTRGNVRLPGIMLLGYVAAHSENLAMAVIVSKVRERGRVGGREGRGGGGGGGRRRGGREG